MLENVSKLSTVPTLALIRIKNSPTLFGFPAAFVVFGSLSKFKLIAKSKRSSIVIA